MRCTVLFRNSKQAMTYYKVRHIVEGNLMVLFVFDDGRLYMKADRIHEIHCLEEVEAGVVPIHAEEARKSVGEASRQEGSDGGEEERLRLRDPAEEGLEAKEGTLNDAMAEGLGDGLQNR